ncbi:MAG: MATE family efflux transporter [Pseudomonadota bacterium]
MPRRDWPAWARASDIVDLVRLALPVAASRAAVPIMSATDVVVLGRNAQLELPYITNGYLLVGLGLAVGMGILQGVQVFTAELSGVGEQRNTGRVLRRGLWVGLVLGVVFTLASWLSAGPMFHYLLVTVPEARAAATGAEFDRAAAELIAAGTVTATNILAFGLIWHMLTVGGSLYLEALRRPGLVTALMYIGVLINLVIDLALVAGWWGLPKMGADGVAWATTGTRIVLTFGLFAVIALMTPGFKRSDPAPKDEFWRQNSVGAGGAIANVAEFGGFNLTFIIATWVSIVAATIYSLAIQPIFLTFMIFMGLGTATSVRVAEAFGRGDAVQVRDASRLGVVACVVVGLFLAAFVWLAREPIAVFMVTRESEAGVDLLGPLTALIGFTALVLIFDGLQGVASMALRAQEVIWTPAAIQIGSYFGIMLPAAYWIGVVQGRGAMGVMEGVLIASLAAGLAQTVVLETKTARRLSQRAVP